MDYAICVRGLSAREVIDVGRFAEDTGYDEVFLPDGSTGGILTAEGKLAGRDSMVSFAALFTATSTIRGTLGVAATPMHHPLVLPTVASSLNELSGGRFSLGVGVSHPEQAARMGVIYPERPVAYMRERLRDLRARSNGGMVAGGGWPVLVAALGPKMTQVGAEEADGLILNWLTPDSVAAAAATVKAAAATTGRPPARLALYLRLMPDSARLADAVSYDAMGNYHRNFVAQGLTTPELIADGTTLRRDDLGAAKARIAEYEAAGLDTVCVYPIGFSPEDRTALAALRS
ncbi:MAG: LLM class flavin-dependent oxidoreductase [Acidimicrobiia bacterium]